MNTFDTEVTLDVPSDLFVNWIFLFFALGNCKQLVFPVPWLVKWSRKNMCSHSCHRVPLSSPKVKLAVYLPGGKSRWHLFQEEERSWKVLSLLLPRGRVLIWQSGTESSLAPGMFSYSVNRSIGELAAAQNLNECLVELIWRLLQALWHTPIPLFCCFNANFLVPILRI